MTGHVAEKKNVTSIMFEVISSYFISIDILKDRDSFACQISVRLVLYNLSLAFKWRKTQRLAIIINNSNFFLFFFSVLVLVFVFVFPADVPDPPTDVIVISRGSRKLNISWTAGFNRNSAI